jgi:hypothetical protein
MRPNKCSVHTVMAHRSNNCCPPSSPRPRRKVRASTAAAMGNIKRPRRGIHGAALAALLVLQQALLAAYVAGTMDRLIGADPLHVRKVSRLAHRWPRLVVRVRSGVACHSTPHALLKERTNRPEHIDIADHTDQLSGVGCQHWHRTNFPIQQDVHQCRPRRVREYSNHV